MKTNTIGTKYDENKPMLSLVPMELIEAVGVICTHGANKYGIDNWKGLETRRIKDAMLRHIVEYMKDENSIDKDSNYLHLWHIATNIAFLCYFQKHKNSSKELDADKIYEKTFKAFSECPVCKEAALRLGKNDTYVCLSCGEIVKESNYQQIQKGKFKSLINEFERTLLRPGIPFPNQERSNCQPTD